MTNTATTKLIHIGRVLPDDLNVAYLLLRKMADYHYQWFQENKDGSEQETSVSASTAEEAIRLARKEWQNQSFRTVICGFRYTLPERDEHGMNALYHQMAASLSSTNGQYLDEDLGHLCIVQNPSLEARRLWQRLKN